MLLHFILFSSICFPIELDTFILLANSIDIHRISLDTDTIVDYVLPVSNVTWAASIDWDDQSNQIFWTDLTLDTISVANLDVSVNICMG